MKPLDSLLFLMRPENLGAYLKTRRHALVGSKVVNLAAELDLKPARTSDLLHGRVTVSKSVIKRLNDIDPEYDVVLLAGVVKKGTQIAEKSSDGKDGSFYRIVAEGVEGAFGDE